MRLTAVLAVVATAWIVSMPSEVMAQNRDRACSNSGNRPPFCNTHAVPEIDAASGLAAIAAVLAGLALAREWRLRRI